MGLKFFSRIFVQGVKYLCPPLGLVCLVLGSLFVGGLAHRGRCSGINRCHRHGAYLPDYHVDVLQENCYLTLRITARSSSSPASTYSRGIPERRVRRSSRICCSVSAWALGHIRRAADHHPDPGMLHRLDRYPHDHVADSPRPLNLKFDPCGWAWWSASACRYRSCHPLRLLHFYLKGIAPDIPLMTSTRGSCLSSSCRC
jgi:hypothetical protein